jgi:hypothetical protein
MCTVQRGCVAGGAFPSSLPKRSNRRHHRRDLELEIWNLCFMRAHAPMKPVYTRSAYHSRDLAWLVGSSAQRVVTQVLVAQVLVAQVLVRS